MLDYREKFLNLTGTTMVSVALCTLILLALFEGERADLASSSISFNHIRTSSDHVHVHVLLSLSRYSDIVVHRLLAAALGLTSLPPAYADRSRLQELCTHMNRRHKAAQYVQRASVNLHTVLFFKTRKSSVETGYVLRVTAEKITIFIPRFSLEGYIKVASQMMELGATAEYVEETSCLHLRSDKQPNTILRSFQVFQKVPVMIRIKELPSGNCELEIQYASFGDEVLSEPMVELRRTEPPRNEVASEPMIESKVSEASSSPPPSSSKNSRKRKSRLIKLRVS
jgi:hypothetical protein